MAASREAYQSEMAGATASWAGKGWFPDLDAQRMALEQAFASGWASKRKEEQDRYGADYVAKMRDLTAQAQARQSANAASVTAAKEAEAQKTREASAAQMQGVQAKAGVLSPQDIAIAQTGFAAGKTLEQVQADIDSARTAGRQKLQAQAEEAVTRYQQDLAGIRGQAVTQGKEDILRQMPSNIVNSGALEAALARMATRVGTQEAQQVAGARLGAQQDTEAYSRALGTMSYQDAINELQRQLQGQYRGEERAGTWQQYQDALKQQSETQSLQTALNRFANLTQAGYKEPAGWWESWGKDVLGAGTSIAGAVGSFLPKKK